MSKDEALKLALEALEVYWGKAEHRRTKEDESKAVEAITAIKEALAKDEKGLFIDLIAQHEGLAEELAQDEQSSSQEPVEDVVAYHSDGTRTVRIAPKRPWAGLTDEPTYTEQQIANACWAAEISDSKCESLLIALQEAAPNIGVKP